ncbi:MAG TPA: cation:proton antiporter [Syntrophomonas sp.]|nr:cation:proton antiporter [Syntrophomonas sp.]
MSASLIALIMAVLAFAASVISIETAISVTIIEILLGVIGGNFLGLHTTSWIDFLATTGSILLTFSAGAEVDVDLMKKKLKESLLIGIISFLAPFAAAFSYCYYVAGWSFAASEIAGIALSTTSLAVVYAVLVETGLTNTETGKILMASCFVTDLGTAIALSVLFAQVKWQILIYIAVSVVVILLAPRVIPRVFKKYGDRVIEPEIKFIFLLLFLLIYVSDIGASHAVLPAFILGLVLSKTMAEHRQVQKKLRIVSFAMLTPFFFIKAGMNVSLQEISMNLGLLAILFLVKLIPKLIGVYPLARKYVTKDAVFTTLLMSTGLTFGTISSMFGLNAGYINVTQFSLLVTTVILSAVVPTFIAQKWFEPDYIIENQAQLLSDNNDV